MTRITQIEVNNTNHCKLLIIGKLHILFAWGAHSVQEKEPEYQCSNCKKEFFDLESGFEHFEKEKHEWGGLIHLKEGDD